MSPEEELENIQTPIHLRKPHGGKRKRYEDLPPAQSDIGWPVMPPRGFDDEDGESEESEEDEGRTGKGGGKNKNKKNSRAQRHPQQVKNPMLAAAEKRRGI